MMAPGLTEQDEHHLQLLSVFHYVVAAMQALFATFPILHFAMGAAIVFWPEVFPNPKGKPPPTAFGWAFMIFAGTWMLVGWTLAVCTVVAGRSLAQRRRHLFCFVVAAVMAATCMPFGTVLGIFTIIVLMRPSVKAAFGVMPAA